MLNWLRPSPVKVAAPAVAQPTDAVLDRVGAAYKRERDAAHATLLRIAEMETPSCASIGKRMAGIARAALPASVKGAE